MLVKVFILDGEESLIQGAVNDWLGENGDITIKHVTKVYRARSPYIVTPKRKEGLILIVWYDTGQNGEEMAP
jgi:hypothetical protein